MSSGGSDMATNAQWLVSHVRERDKLGTAVVDKFLDGLYERCEGR